MTTTIKNRIIKTFTNEVKKNMAKSSMHDVANEAKVSIATVSHVINNDKAVSEATRKKVLDAIEKLNYKPNLVARRFKTGEKKIVAFIVPDIANPFFATLIEEVESVLAKEGYKLIIANTKETKQRELENIKTLSCGFADAFIIASTLEDYKEMEGYLPSDVPAIFIDRLLPRCPYESICINSYDATKTSVEYLIMKGHTKIGFIAGLERISTSRERLTAYKDAMTEANLLNENYIKIGNSMSHCVDSHLTSLIDQGCTAIVIANNLMATEALIQLLNSGILAEKKLELVGFKDSDQAQYGLQHMSMIIQPTAQLGRITGMQLLKKIEDGDVKGNSHTILQSIFVPKERIRDYM